MKVHSKHLSGLAEYLGQRLRDERTRIYRGVTGSNFTLIPAIGRCKAASPKDHEDYERKIFEEFKQRAIPYLSREPRSDFEWLFLAQHYGIPTRLLDWSTGPLIALYFACEKQPEKECAVYKIVMDRWYVNYDESDPCAVEQIGGLQPRHSDLRYINQSGVFTIHPRPTDPMEWPAIGKYLFRPEIKEGMRWQLRKMGINASVIYPSLDSIARDIINEYEVILKGRVVRISGNQFEF